MRSVLACSAALGFSLTLDVMPGCSARVLAADASPASARNPIIWADVPDVAMIRVGDTYYMSSTTMHMSPGLPIMKSNDLVKWDLIGYAYDTLTDNENLRLENGKNCYGAGSWASSLRYHNGTFYATTFSATSGKTHVYTTKDIEKGPWQAHAFAPMLHDHSLFFDDDGRTYMIYGAGDIRIKELIADASAVKQGGLDRVIIRNASRVAGERVGLPAEGSQMLKVDGMYYIFNIAWPPKDMRTVLVHRADKITGPYEGRVALHDKGVAQGGMINTPGGKWYAYMFQDHGAVGRIPYLVPMKWEHGWPVLGKDGKVPMTLDIPGASDRLGNMVTSDEFSRKQREPLLPLAWQWNHNPDNRYWSLDKRPGWLRLTNGRIDLEVTQTRNTLTQRTFGPVCSATTSIDVSGMRDGDSAGLILLQKKYGFVGIRMTNGRKFIVMVSAKDDAPEEQASIPLDQHTVCLRVDCDFRNRTDKAFFYYSLDGEKWTDAGRSLQMTYTLPHFMGYRFGLFNFATKVTGGFADFDFFRISHSISASNQAG